MKVKFLPEGVEHEIDSSQSVMELAHEKGVKIKSVCNGLPSCAECRVKLVDGEHNVLPPSAKELSLIGTGHFIDQRRLSCQLYCFGDVVIDLSEQLEKVHTDQQRRPQGNLRKEDSEVSRAVTGNLIEEEEKLLENLVVDESSNRQRPRGRRNDRNRNRRRNRKPKNKSHD